MACSLLNLLPRSGGLLLGGEGERQKSKRVRVGDAEYRVPDQGFVGRNERQRRHKDGQPTEPDQNPSQNSHDVFWCESLGPSCNFASSGK